MIRTISRIVDHEKEIFEGASNQVFKKAETKEDVKSSDGFTQIDAVFVGLNSTFSVVFCFVKNADAAEQSSVLGVNNKTEGNSAGGQRSSSC